MERSSQELELYTIPSYSSWFSWNNIHEVERFSLREFFDGSSVSRSPRIYKEYRDFIISKFRENPSKNLTFTEVRKSLVGDISVLLKVFTFLEKWGLINFKVSDGNNEKGKNCAASEGEEEEICGERVKFEEGAPYGVRVVAAPNSMKPIVAPPPLTSLGRAAWETEDGGGFKWPQLASYSDVYWELMHSKNNALICESCKENYDSVCYEYTKEDNFILCEKCFKAGKIGDNKSADDFKFKIIPDQGAVWTEAETLLLLESVIEHGDDWDLVARNVQTKSRVDCISKLIQLPFGDLVLDAARRKSTYFDNMGDRNNFSDEGIAASEPDKEDTCHQELPSNALPNGYVENGSPQKKKVCMGLTSNVGSSLMKQVAQISSMLGPQVATSAAEAAITSLCYDNQCSREIFEDYDDIHDAVKAPSEVSDQNRATEVDNAVEDEKHNESEIPKNIIPLNLRARVASATTLGAAAANAKLLADQEEREMGQLVATMIEAQVKKLKRKMNYFEDLEMIMKKEEVQIEELEESLVAERLKVLQTLFSADINISKGVDASSC